MGCRFFSPSARGLIEARIGLMNPSSGEVLRWMSARRVHRGALPPNWSATIRPALFSQSVRQKMPAARQRSVNGAQNEKPVNAPSTSASSTPIASRCWAARSGASQRAQTRPIGTDVEKPKIGIEARTERLVRARRPRRFERRPVAHDRDVGRDRRQRRSPVPILKANVLRARLRDAELANTRAVSLLAVAPASR